jgi:DNA-binding transcriptional ArsR family regulator
MALDSCDLLCLDLPKAEAVRGRLATLDVASAAAAARALGDPTRLAVAASLATGEELCVCDLSWIVGRSDKLVSHHVRALRDSGLAESRRDGKVVFYRLTPLGSSLVSAIVGQRSGAPA